MRRATLRTTPESSTTRHVFILAVSLFKVAALLRGEGYWLGCEIEDAIDVVHGGDRRAEQLPADHGGDVFGEEAFGALGLAAAHFDLSLSFAHDLVGKPLHTFPDHALRRVAQFSGLLFQRRDQAGTVELAD